MPDQFSRSTMLFGQDAMDTLYQSSVIIFGVGGVGGYAAEAIARSGIGRIGLVDDDKICLTNLNRQLIATHETIGKYKVDVMRDRILSINPKAKVDCYSCFYLPDNADGIELSYYDYVIDAVDTVTAKIEIIMRAKTLGIPLLSCMGAANKIDPTAFIVTDIYKTKDDPLARVMRRELRKRKINDLKVVVSMEKNIKEKAMNHVACVSGCETDCICPPGTKRKCTHRRQIPASNAFVPPVAGLIAAGEAVKDLIGYRQATSSRMSSITS